MKEMASRFVLVAALATAQQSAAYPIDGFAETGIRRLALVRARVEGSLPGPIPVSGGLRSIDDIRLHLSGTPAGDLQGFPAPEAALQQGIERLFPDRHESYSIALLDMTPGKPMRYAAHQADREFSPGSVGKLAIAAGLFAELARLYPADIAARRRLLRERLVTADEWIIKDEHPVPLYDPADSSYVSRPVQIGDTFSLYEWTDHMLSASANSAGSTVWKEAMLMRAFGSDYPPTRAREESFYRETPKAELQRIALSVVNDPLRAAGITAAAWQLGSFFTDTGQRIVPGTRSWATPAGMLCFLLRLEQGRIVDEWSSLETKRLLYMTAHRIRYASSPAIAKSAVYFKSGSLFACRQEEGFKCGKYMGNAMNYMNSVAIVETSDGRVYLVALMSNVLRKNSAVDHQSLATEIERLLAR